MPMTKAQRAITTYYIRWIRTAFQKPLSPYNLATVFAVVLSFVAKWIPWLDPYELVIDICFYAFAATLLVGFVLAPYFMHKEQHEAIRVLKAQLEPSLTIAFNKAKHRIDQGSSILFCIGLCNPTKKAIDRVSVTLEDVEPLSNKRRLRREVKRMIGLPLMLQKDIEGHQDVLPTTEFNLNGESKRNIAVVCGEAGGRGIHVFHGDYRFGNAVLSNGNKAREPRTPTQIPPGRYRVTIAAKGADGSSDSRSFIVSLTAKTFTFNPDDDRSGLVSQR